MKRCGEPMRYPIDMTNPLNGPGRFKRSRAASWLENYDERHRRPRPGRPGTLDAPTVRALRRARGAGKHGDLKHLARCWGINYATARDAAAWRTYKHVTPTGPVREVTPEECVAGNHAWLQERDQDHRNP